MNEVNERVQWELRCESWGLGELVGLPRPISGGHLHKMFALTTSKGKYAVKVLNPTIMARPTAIQNYLRSEEIARRASQSLPAQPALIRNGSVLHCVNNQYYLIYDWMTGNPLRETEITPHHCQTMGAILASLHAIDFDDQEPTTSSDSTQVVDWDFYLKEGVKHQAEWCEQLSVHLSLLYDANHRAIKAAAELATHTVISHRDLEPKNVMWVENQPTLIDWESAGRINPIHDLIETAVYWAQGQGRMDQDRFMAFIRGYRKDRLALKADWNVLLDHGFLAKIEWLAYNLQRSLGIACTDAEEQQLGTEQVVQTLSLIHNYAEMTEQLKDWIESANK